jgi:RNA polymerase sigma factor (sigma-70 family)
MQTEDADLIARFLADERQAVAAIDSWLVHAALPYRRRLAEGWDDLLQDLRLEITRLFKEERFRGEASLRTYLYRVVSHAALNRIRARERWQFTAIEDDGHNPRAEERTESKDLLLRILAQTSAECRRMWTLILEGHDYHEMSRRLGVAEGALRVRVLRCRRRAVEVRARLFTKVEA